MVRSAPPENASLPEVMTQPLMAASPATRRRSFFELVDDLRSSSTFIGRPGMSQVTSAMPSPSTSNLKFGEVHDLVSLSPSQRERAAASAAG
jgi:hypothetical protein